MRCCCCDKVLNDFESCRKSKTTGEYLDMCNTCYATISETVPTKSRPEFDVDEIPDEEVLVEDPSFEDVDEED